MARMNYFLLTSLVLLLALSVKASAQQAPHLLGKESAGTCDRFKMRVITPREDVDYKLRIAKPAEGVDYKGIVIDPCKTETPRIVRSQPFAPDKGSWPSFITPSLKQPWGTDDTLKSPAEMFKKSMQQSGKMKTRR